MPIAVPIAVLAVIAVALVAVVILYGYKQLLRSVFESFRALPVVGGWLASHLEQLLDAANHAAADWAQHATKPLVDALYRWVTRLEGHTQASGRAHQASLDAHVWTNQVLVPQSQQAAQARADAQDAALEERATRHIAEARSHADQTGADAQAAARQLFADATAYARALSAGDQALAQSLMAKAEGDAVSLVAGAVAHADRALGAAVAQAQQEDEAVRAYAAQLAAAVLQNARDLVLGPDGVAVRIERDLAAGDQATLTAALAGAGALVGTVAIAVDAIQRSPCMQRCNTLGGLGAALEALDLTAILLLVAGAGRDPEGTAQAVQSLAQGPVDFARGVFSQLTGTAA